ncbi:MAG TPA: PPC domain-containing DNA-binding protein, partial [Chitinophagaceae bacterium]|nr:PPC domain-containing DNA-binding protein [Chitinophagaceae bacterium]
MKEEKNETYAFRLKPGEDLKIGISQFIGEKGIKAGWVAACVGSLIKYSIRFANQQETSLGNGFFEIVHLTGTVSINGSHLHITISDNTGKTFGGHLMPGSIIYTTAELLSSQPININSPVSMMVPRLGM